MITLSKIGVKLPSNSLNNLRLSIDFPEWKVEKSVDRTGVVGRKIVDKDQTAFDLALAASHQLLDEAEVSAEDIECLICCTQTPDYLMPGNSFLLHEKLKLPMESIVFDINLACSGFDYSVGIARALSLAYELKNILIVCGDTYSRIISEKDRSTRLLFGDGVAAVLLGQQAGGLEPIDSKFYSSGKHWRHFQVLNGGMRNPIQTRGLRESSHHEDDFIAMNGFGILAFFNSAIPKAIDEILERNMLGKEDIRFFVPHQASKVAVEGIAKAVGFASDQVVFDIENTGKITSASIPLALKNMLEADQIKIGDWVITCGFGVGLSWALTLWKMGE